jgi:hypothetical protein
MICIKLGDHREEIVKQLEAMTPKGSEHPWRELVNRVRVMCPGAFGENLFADLLADVLKESYGSAPADQSVSLKIALSEIVDVFTNDPTTGDLLEGLVRSKLRWF